MPSAYALGIVSRNSILDFGVAEHQREIQKKNINGLGEVGKNRKRPQYSRQDSRRT